MKKVGILGGTFDPIHIGHLKMGLQALSYLQLSEVWFMPSGTPAYKLKEHGVTSAADRAEMVRRSIAGYPGFVYSDLEILRQGNTYTADTLHILKEQEPDAELCFIVGADSLDYMERWSRPREIFSMAVIAAVTREGFPVEELQKKADELKAAFGGEIRFVPMENVPVSSTDIRNRVRTGQSISGLVTPETEMYIQEHGLYLEDEG